MKSKRRRKNTPLLSLANRRNRKTLTLESVKTTMTRTAKRGLMKRSTFQCTTSVKERWALGLSETRSTFHLTKTCTHSCSSHWSSQFSRNIVRSTAREIRSRRSSRWSFLSTLTSHEWHPVCPGNNLKNTELWKTIIKSSHGL